MDLRQREAFLIELCENLGVRESLSDAERVFVCVWELESQVNNGGFHLYYVNTAGDNAVDAEAALRKIGASKMAALVAQANSLLPGGTLPRDLDERQEILDDLGEDTLAKWNELDKAFFVYPDDLSRLLYDFVIEHKSGFSDLS